MAINLTKKEIKQIKYQGLVGWLLFFPLALYSLLLIHFKYRIKIKKLKQVRKNFRKITSKCKQPILVCSNHLTLIDSIIIIWALASIKDYFFNYRLFCWNVPAVENFTKKLHWKIYTFLGKCIPIDRFGNKEHQENVLNKLAYIIKSKDLCMIFPEGTRSRTGRVEPQEVTYGIGRIIKDVENCHVLCIYLRGDKQHTYSDYPDPNDNFSLQMELIKPKSAHSGLRAIRDYSQQVILKIKELEDRYFAFHKTSA